MDKIEKKLQRLIYAFIMSVIIIVAAFAVTIYYYETKETTGFGVGGEAMFAKAFVDENIGTAPLTVNFSSLAFNYEGAAKYHWDFGDGNTSNLTSPIYNYTKEGNYTCTLTITDATGKNITTSVNVIVLANRPPTVVVLVSPVDSPRPWVPVLDSLTALPTIGDLLLISLAKANLSIPGAWITCEGQAFDPEGAEIVSYEWELTQPPIRILGTTQYPKFYFEGKDLKNITFPLVYTYRWQMYSIKLTVTDSAGNKASDVKTFGVGGSDVMMTRNKLQKQWGNFWKTGYLYLPTDLQQLLSTTVWSVFGPAETFTYKIIEKLPPSLRGLFLLGADFIWEQQEKKYRKPNNPPNIPSDPDPADGAPGIDLDADLSWNCSDPDDHPLTYDIYFGTTSPPPLVISGYKTENNTFALGPLDSSTTYYWKIVAHDTPPTGREYSETVTSPIWSFTTTV